MNPGVVFFAIGWAACVLGGAATQQLRRVALRLDVWLGPGTGTTPPAYVRETARSRLARLHEAEGWRGALLPLSPAAGPMAFAWDVAHGLAGDIPAPLRGWAIALAVAGPTAFCAMFATGIAWCIWPPDAR